jgi:hypothetical protein
MLTSNSSNFTRMLLVPESVTNAGFRVRGYFQTSGGSNGSFSNYNYAVWTNADSNPEDGTFYTGAINASLGTTSAGTCQINIHYHTNGWSDTWYAGVYYRITGTSTWTLAGSFGYNNPNNSGGAFDNYVTISPTQLGTPNAFDVQIVVMGDYSYGNGGSPGMGTGTQSGTGYFAVSYVYGANNTEDTSSQIAYIAMESSS